MPHSDPTPDDWELLLNTLPQSSLNTFPQPIFDTESVPVFYMFVQSDGQQPTSSSRMMENIQESQLSENDSNTYSPTTAIRSGIPIPDRQKWCVVIETPRHLKGNTLPELGQKLHLNNTQSRTKEPVMDTDVARRWSITRGRDCLSLNTLRSQVLPLVRYGACVA